MAEVKKVEVKKVNAATLSVKESDKKVYKGGEKFRPIKKKDK